jgi:hypothetical protein
MYLTYTRHRVKDYDTWRAAFDANAPMLKKTGVIDTFITQVEGDPNDIVVINTWPAKKNWEDFIAAHNFKDAGDIKKMQEKGGLIGEPEWFGGKLV